MSLRRGTAVLLTAAIVALLISPHLSHVPVKPDFSSMTFDQIVRYRIAQAGNKSAARSAEDLAAHDHRLCGTETKLSKPHRSAARDSSDFEIPECGATICDDPDLVLAYLDVVNNPKRQLYNAKMKVWSLAKSDGSDALATPEKRDYQLEVMNRYFDKMGIKYEMDFETINSDFLYYGQITINECTGDRIGNGIRDPYCAEPANGWDGGDFNCGDSATCDEVCTIENIENGVPGTEDCTCFCIDFSKCTAAMKGDGICDSECNFPETDYDDGDCCLDPSEGNCLDRNRSTMQRSFIDIVDIRLASGADFKKALHIYVGLPSMEGLLGVSVFPWTVSYDSSEYGGFLMNHYVFGNDDDDYFRGTVSVHEAGHSFGLWHTFHGVTEMEDFCFDECFEHQYAVGSPGMMLKGDLCSDTRPTPINYECADPEPCTGIPDIVCADCNGKSWVSTPVTNIMGYSNPVGPCREPVLSPQQLARGRCYYDLYYNGWDDSDIPSPVVIAPEADYVDGKVQVSWPEPLNKGPSSDPVKYRITRNPAFSFKGTAESSTNSYSDSDILPNTDPNKYTYSVTSFNSAGENPVSSPTTEVDDDKDDSSTDNTALIAGVTVGVIGGAGALAASAVYISKKRRPTPSYSASPAL
eukprot:TRINITY_DN5160_c0_g1_i1.p1 TRINITY_DN5160_c0_g1~~TRINITY_DN5160_c0_g1_i1.p1  ORF type:complete len:638 (+),score=130.39 TRINITY_DN5160_c0_g1_i1:70-1983(+)